MYIPLHINKSINCNTLQKKNTLQREISFLFNHCKSINKQTNKRIRAFSQLSNGDFRTEQQVLIEIQLFFSLAYLNPSFMVRKNIFVDVIGKPQKRWITFLTLNRLNDLIKTNVEMFIPFLFSFFESFKREICKFRIKSK